jgi:phosphatidylglycerophosphatase A
VGFLPFAPGTAGTLLGVPVAWLLSLADPYVQIILVVAAVPVAALVCGRAASQAGESDPCWIVVDEIVGYGVAVLLVPPSFSAYLAGFLSFRLFDILKPPPIGWVDRHMAGGWGILLDDVLAGLYTRLFLWVLLQAGTI